MDLIKNPLEVVSSLYHQAGRPAQDNSDWGVGDLAKQLMSNPAAIDQVPWLTPETIDKLPNNSLIRYRGMVRDMFNKEIYAGLYRDASSVIQTTKYSDVDIPDGGEELACYWERQALYCVPIPSESQWSRNRYGGIPVCPPTPERGSTEPRKRQRDDESMSEASCAANGACQNTVDMTEVSSASKRQAVDDVTTNVPMQTNTALPALEHNMGDCITYVYGEVSAKLHDVVEVVGVVSKVPQLAALGAMAGEDGDMMEEYLRAEIAATHPPTSLVFRVHALFVQKASSTYPPLLAEPAALQAAVPMLRERALTFLGMALGGDRLASEYVLLQLLTNFSASGHRSSNLAPPHLNLTRCPAAAVPAGSTASSPLGSSLCAALAALAPRCRCLPLTLAALNAQRLAPAQDPISTRLHPGLLQLAPGTLLVLDETVLAEGQLGDAGCKNVQVLTQLLGAQSVPCMLPYGAVDLPVDVPVLCLSSARSVFRTHLPLVVPLNPTAEPADAASITAASMQADLDPVRDYLAAVRGLVLELPEAVQEGISADYASARQEDASIGPDLLHIWLTVAKLLAISHGDSTLSAERWREARAMEQKREERLRVV